MTDAALSHVLDRDIFIRAPQATVFSFFTDSARWASWWGAGSTIEPVVGGTMYIRHPNGIEAGGRILAIDPPDQVVFSYGFASGVPMPVGASTVTIRCVEENGGTRVLLHHAFAERTVRDEHVQGWRFQLSLFANAVSGLVNAGATDKIDSWFSAWAEPDPATREAVLGAVAAASVIFARGEIGRIDEASARLRQKDARQMCLSRPRRALQPQHRIRPGRPAHHERMRVDIAGADEEILRLHAWRERQVESELTRPGLIWRAHRSPASITRRSLAPARGAPRHRAGLRDSATARSARARR